MKIRYTVAVTQEVEVVLEANNFTEAFIEEHQRFIGGCDTIEDHAENLARLVATGVVDNFPSTFVEGYGPLKDMGIEIKDPKLGLLQIVDRETMPEAE